VRLSPSLLIELLLCASAFDADHPSPTDHGHGRALGHLSGLIPTYVSADTPVKGLSPTHVWEGTLRQGAYYARLGATTYPEAKNCNGVNDGKLEGIRFPEGPHRYRTTSKMSSYSDTSDGKCICAERLWEAPPTPPPPRDADGTRRALSHGGPSYSLMCAPTINATCDTGGSVDTWDNCNEDCSVCAYALGQPRPKRMFVNSLAEYGELGVCQPVPDQEETLGNNVTGFTHFKTFTYNAETILTLMETTAGKYAEVMSCASSQASGSARVYVEAGGTVTVGRGGQLIVG